MFFNSSLVDVKIFCSDSNLSRRFIAAAGPIPGKPSKMNCFCSSVV